MTAALPVTIDCHRLAYRTSDTQHDCGCNAGNGIWDDYFIYCLPLGRTQGEACLLHGAGRCPHGIFRNGDNRWERHDRQDHAAAKAVSPTGRSNVFCMSGTITTKPKKP